MIDLGFNPCSVHEDTMIGGPNADVAAVPLNGEIRPGIKDGTILM